MLANHPSFSHYLNILRHTPLFSNLAGTTLAEMLASFQRQTWPKNSSMETGNSSGQFLYVIINGRVKMSRINPDSGRELTIFLMSTGDVFDVICLLDEYEHDVSLTAIDEVETLYAPMPEVRNWIEKHPEFNRAFLPYLGQQIRSLEELAADLSLHDTITRLSRLILRHTAYNNNHTPLTAAKPATESLHINPLQKLKLINNLSHEELAHMIGSVRAVISRHMLKLQHDGIIKYKRKYLEIKEIHSLLEKAKKTLSMRPK